MPFSKTRIREHLGLVAGTVVFGLVMSELVLQLAGLPEEHQRHEGDPQFAAVEGAEFVYVNKPSATIRVVYDSDPRGYFGRSRAVVHRTNALGFRGAAFAVPKPPGVFRIALLGDSVTFGEGVKDQDTFSERLRRLSAERRIVPGASVETVNLGVGGFNTVQEAALLRRLIGTLAPDHVILEYALDDVEPAPAMSSDSGGWQRRDRAAYEAGSAEAPRPPVALGMLRLTRLMWLSYERRRIAERTLAYYRSLYADGNPDREKAWAALDEIATLCRSRGIPLTVVIVPVLARLDRDYPFAEMHSQARARAERLGSRVVDLLPAFHDYAGPELWVHPSDRHPNEIAHRIVAQALLDDLAAERRAAGSGTGVR